MWVYRSNEVSEKPVVIYYYQAGRDRACAEAFYQVTKVIYNVMVTVFMMASTV